MTFWKLIKWHVLIFTIFHEDAAYQSVLLLYVCTTVLVFYYPKCKTEKDLPSKEPRWYWNCWLASQYRDSGGLQNTLQERSAVLCYADSKWERLLLKAASPWGLTPILLHSLHALTTADASLPRFIMRNGANSSMLSRGYSCSTRVFWYCITLLISPHITTYS